MMELIFSLYYLVYIIFDVGSKCVPSRISKIVSTTIPCHWPRRVGLMEIEIQNTYKALHIAYP